MKVRLRCTPPTIVRPARALAALAALVVPAAAAAQAPADTSSPPTGCYRFAFGRWDPPLDWRAAGHEWGPGSVRPKERYPATPVPSGPASRGSASWEKFRSDSALVIYPPWWPVGVLVRLAAPAIAAGDTVDGTATAYVADAAVRAPTSTVRAWRGRCRT